MDTVTPPSLVQSSVDQLTPDSWNPESTHDILEMNKNSYEQVTLEKGRKNNKSIMGPEFNAFMKESHVATVWTIYFKQVNE